MHDFDRRRFMAMVPVGLVGLGALAGCDATSTEGSDALSAAGELRDLRIKVFPGGFNLPLWAAQENGLFEARNVNLIVSETGSSIEQMTDLMEGEQDIVLTGMDNVVAYSAGQGAVDFDEPANMFAFMGGDNAFLRLVVQDDIQSYEDLRGKTLSVDALTTGFAFVLKAMLAANGLSEGDYELVSAGGVTQRFEQLMAGDHAGTLLLTPFELFAEGAGLRTLQSADEVIPDYQGIVGAARRGWAEENGPLLTDFIAGYLAGLDWLFDPANREDADALLASNLSQLSPEIRSQTLDIFLGEQGGFEPRARINERGVEEVIQIRSRFAEGEGELEAPASYFDLSYYNQATS